MQFAYSLPAAFFAMFSFTAIAAFTFAILLYALFKQWIMQKSLNSIISNYAFGVLISSRHNFLTNNMMVWDKPRVNLYSSIARQPPVPRLQE